MQLLCYPDPEKIMQCYQKKDTFLVLVSIDGERVLVGRMEEVLEHHTLLTKFGIDEAAIDNYFRLTVDEEGVDWLFVCPPNYKGITNPRDKLETYYLDGFHHIPVALLTLGSPMGIHIHKRFRKQYESIIPPLRP